MLSSFFFGGGGSGGAVGHHHGGAMRDEKAARRGSSSNPTATTNGGTASTNSRSWTSLFFRRDKNNSTPDGDYSSGSKNSNSDVVKKRKSNGITAASTSTLSLALARPVQVPVRDQTGSSPSPLTPKPRRHSSAQHTTAAPTTTPKTKSSSKLQRQSLPASSKKSSNPPPPSTDSLKSKRGNPAPGKNIVVSPPTGGYASSKPIQAEPQIPSFRHSVFGSALLAQNPLFPKPAAYLYTVRTALSSTMSGSPSPPPLELPKRHGKRDHSPSPSRRHSSATRKSKHQPSRDIEQPEIGIELLTPPDSRKTTPAHHHRPRESSRNLSTIKEDAPERSRGRSKKHRHRTPEEREEREKRKRKAREAEEDRLEDGRRHRERTPVPMTPEQPTRTPPPPPHGYQEPIPPTPRYTTPIIPQRRESQTPGGQSMLRASATTIYQAIRTVGSKSSRDQLSNPSPKSSGTRVVLQQTDQSIKVKVDSPSGSKHYHRDEDSTDSDESECHTPKGAEFPISKGSERKDSAQYSPNVKIVGEDVSEDLYQTETIDFLLPYGGLQEQFDSGYEIEQEIFEDELDAEDTEEDDDTVHAPGAQPAKKLQGGLNMLASSIVNADPLSQQLPVLLSLVDNTVTAYETILETQGSFAVGIGGYQPVARRLLEKVGKLFSRELPAEAATWGETLEYISGRKEYPELADVDFNDEEAIAEFFEHNEEKMFIYNACLEEPDVLDPAIEGLRRLMDEDVTPEETAIYLTSYPNLRPLLLACKHMTDDELEILESKRAAAFLNVDIAVRSDKQREITECTELSKGIDETVKQLEATIARMKSVQSNILKRKKGIEAHLAVHAPNDDEIPTLPAEIQTAIDEIQNEDNIKMEERKRRKKELKREAEEEDDGDTLLPDDSISQINPYRARYIPQSVTRAYQEAQTRAAASVAQVPASIASTKTSTSILHEYLAARAPPRQTQMASPGGHHMHSAGFEHGSAGGMLPNGVMPMGPGGITKKPSAYVRMALPVKVYGAIVNEFKDAVRKLPLHHGSKGNLEVIPEKNESPENIRSVTPDTMHLTHGTPSPYDDAIYRSNSRGSAKAPTRNVSGASSKRSGLFSKKPMSGDEVDRSCTPVVVGHGGYGSSKPPVVANEVGAVKKDRGERDKDRERRRREKGKSGSSSRRRESYAEKQKR